MAFYKQVGKNTESNTLDNRVVSTDDLRVKIKQILSEEQWHQIEPVEVIDLVTTAEKQATKRKVQYGKIIGRYVYSEQSKPLTHLSAKTFKPLGSNVIQMPVVGEVVMGIEFFGERFYIPMSMIKKIDGKSDLLPKLNYTHKNISATNTIKDGSDVQGVYFRDTKKKKVAPREGDTLIQGRFGNYIKLSSNQIKDLTDELGDDALEVVKETFFDSPNIDINVNSTSTSGSRILMTTSQSIQYPEQVINFGKSMSKIQPSGEQFETKDYSSSQIYIDSERLVFNASKDDIGIFANNRVHIKGGKGGVQISNAKGAVAIKAKEVVEDFKDGKKLQISKDLMNGDVILAPDNMKEMGAVLAKQVEWNLDFIKVQVGSLLPAGIPGLPKFTVNPAWMKNVRDKIANAKKLLEFNDLVLKLKWLDNSKWKTYTMDELKEAFKPIPGFGSIIAGFASLKQLKGNIDKVKDEVEEKVAMLEAAKSGELLDVDNLINSYKDELVSDFDKSLGIDKAKDLKNKIDDYKKSGQKTSDITGADGLNQRLDTYIKLEDDVEKAQSFEGGIQDTVQLSLLIQRRDEASQKLNEYISRGSADGFSERINSLDIEIQSMKGSMDLLNAMVEVSDEADKIESVNT